VLSINESLISYQGKNYKTAALKLFYALGSALTKSLKNIALTSL
jgi:hypothetical protein